MVDPLAKPPPRHKRHTQNSLAAAASASPRVRSNRHRASSQKVHDPNNSRMQRLRLSLLHWHNLLARLLNTARNNARLIIDDRYFLSHRVSFAYLCDRMVPALHETMESVHDHLTRRLDNIVEEYHRAMEIYINYLVDEREIRKGLRDAIATPRLSERQAASRELTATESPERESRMSLLTAEIQAQLADTSAVEIQDPAVNRLSSQLRSIAVQLATHGRYRLRLSESIRVGLELLYESRDALNGENPDGEPLSLDDRLFGLDRAIKGSCMVADEMDALITSIEKMWDPEGEGGFSVEEMAKSKAEGDDRPEVKFWNAVAQRWVDEELADERKKRIQIEVGLWRDGAADKLAGKKRGREEEEMDQDQDIEAGPPTETVGGNIEVTRTVFKPRWWEDGWGVKKAKVEDYADMTSMGAAARVEESSEGSTNAGLNYGRRRESAGTQGGSGQTGQRENGDESLIEVRERRARARVWVEEQQKDRRPVEQPKDRRPEEQPKDRRLEEQPKDRRLEEQPKDRRLEEQPKDRRLEEQPKDRRPEEQPKDRRLEEQPKDRRLEEQPKDRRLEEQPKDRRLEELPKEQSKDRRPEEKLRKYPRERRGFVENHRETDNDRSNNRQADYENRNRGRHDVIRDYDRAPKSPHTYPPPPPPPPPSPPPPPPPPVLSLPSHDVYTRNHHSYIPSSVHTGSRYNAYRHRAVDDRERYYESRRYLQEYRY